MNAQIRERLEKLHASLNPEQREGALAVEGPVIVVAGAGAGKTKTLIHRVATLIEMGVAPSNVMVVTFTNKAAQEIRDRLGMMVGELGEHVVAGTFHSIVFNHILKGPYESRYLEEVGIDSYQLAILDDDEAVKLLREAYRSLDEEDLEFLEESEIPLSALASVMSAARARGDDVDRFEARIGRSVFASELPSTKSGPLCRESLQVVVRLWRDYEYRCRKVHGIDFDDILVYAAKMLEAEPHIAKSLSETFRYLMLDEYQDTNRVQMQIMDSIARHHRNIFVVGDEKQSVYGFRGADISVILSFKKRYPEARQIDMMRNYRSEPHIITAANACAKAMSQRLSDGQLVAMRQSSSSAPALVEFPDAATEASIVAKALARDLRSGIPGKEIAVLYRKRSLKNELERELIEADLPFELIGDISFYQKAEVKDALAMIRFVFRPWDTMGVLRTVRATTLGVSESAVKNAVYKNSKTGIGFLQEQSQRRLKPKKAGEAGELAKTAQVVEPLLSLCELIREAGEAGEDPSYIKDCLARLWEIYFKPGLLKAARRASGSNEMQNVESRIDNVAFLLERFSKGLECGKTPETVLEELSLLAEMVNSRMERDAEQKIKLMTMHAAKGLEFENVYLIGLDQEAMSSDDSSLEPDEVEEARRIMYVALTRARRKLAMSYARERYEMGNILHVDRCGFLDEITRGGSVVQRRYRAPVSEQPSLSPTTS